MPIDFDGIGKSLLVRMKKVAIIMVPPGARGHILN